MPYQHITRRGYGGFGEVWEVLRESDRQRFAKKILMDQDHDARARFGREVRLLLTMDNPQIVRVVEHDLNCEQPWFIMPLFQGSLADHCQELIGQPARVERIFGHILEGMEYAHSRQIIHRDLKPANILMNSDDDLVIADFGLGRRLDAETTRQTATNQYLGTFGYMAPEQLQDAFHADARADVYALGIILRELCTGATHPLAPMHETPTWLQVVISRCLQVRPEERYESAAALRAALTTIRTRIEAGQAVLTIPGLDRERLHTIEIAKIARLIAGAAEDRRVLHDLAGRFPENRLRELNQFSPEIFRLLASQFATESMEPESWWGFEYIDVIAGTAHKFHRCTRDVELRALMIGTVLKTGVEYNRFAAMQDAAELIGAVREDREALALLTILQPLSGLLAAIADRVQMAQLNPHIRVLFQINTPENE